MEMTILIKNLFYLHLTTNEYTVNRHITLFREDLVRTNTQAQIHEPVLPELKTRKFLRKGFYCICKIGNELGNIFLKRNKAAY